MRVALVHDYLNQAGGAERVFAHFVRAWPDAPVFTALYDERVASALVPRDRVRTSFLAKIPGANRAFRLLAPLYPAAFEAFDFSGYDTIVSSTTAWAKGIRVPPASVHVCYVNTVSRFAFAYDEYVAAQALGGRLLDPLVRIAVRRLVEWDKRAAARPTQLIANSWNVARRIERYYGRPSVVVPCPVDLDRFSVGPGDGDYFIIASRLLRYKRIDLAIRACALAGARLIVVGTGPDERRLREIAAECKGAELVGFVSDRTLNALLGAARAAIVPGEEDFGLVPLEAAAAGRPTIAFRGGGALETIVEGQTGEFFDDARPESLAARLRSFDGARYDRHKLRVHAEAFAPAVFIERIRQIVAETRDGKAPA